MNLLRAAATVSGLTFLSRITGLVRESLTASVFGAGSDTDAFFVAFRIPNLLRRLFSEGAFSQAFVPLLGQIRTQQGDLIARQFIDRVAVVLSYVLIAVSLIGVLAAPLLVWALASGQSPATLDKTVLLTRIMFPYIALISLVGLSSGILNTWRHFAVPAASPVLLNLSVIAAAWWLVPYLASHSSLNISPNIPPITGLAVGVMLGGVLQLLIQIPALRHYDVLPDVRVSFKTAWGDSGVRRVLTNMGPALFGVGVAQIALILNTTIASHLVTGSASWLSFADRLMEFPTALLGIALGTVLMPSLTRAAAQSDTAQFNALLNWGLRLTLLLALPAAVALAILAQPLVAVLYHYGKFSAVDVSQTQSALAFYALGIIGFSLIKIFAPAFYAQQNIRTPVKIAIAVLVVGQLCNLITVPLLAHAGLALSLSLGALFNAGWLWFSLSKDGHFKLAAGFLRFSLQLAFACVLMAVTLWWANAQFNWIALQATPSSRIAYVLGLCAAGAAAYFASLWAVGVNLPATLRQRV